MTDKKDRRKAPRYKYTTSATYIWNGRLDQICRVKTISREGATVELNQHIPPHERIQLSFPDDGVIEAEVVWCQIEPAVAGGPDQRSTYTCGLKYKDVINEAVNEILEEIESRN